MGNVIYLVVLGLVLGGIVYFYRGWSRKRNAPTVQRGTGSSGRVNRNNDNASLEK